MGKLWGHFFAVALCLAKQSVYSMNEQQLISASTLDKARWGAKVTVYGACTIGSGMLLVTQLHDFAINNTPETSIATRFAGIGTALVGLKCFGFAAYKALRELIADHSDKEELIREIIERLTAAQIYQQPVKAASSSSFALQNSIQNFSINILGKTPHGSTDSVSSILAATKRNGIDTLLKTSHKNNLDPE